MPDESIWGEPLPERDVDTEEVTEPEVRLPRKHGSVVVMVTEEAYVAHEVAVTRSLMAMGMKDVIVDGKGRLDRTEAYARKRWQGVKAGEVAFL